MKAIARLTFLLLLSTSAGCQPKFTRVDDDKIDGKRLEFATELSNKILSVQRDGGFYNLSGLEATAEMQSAFDESLQKKSYQQIKSAFGDYQNLKFSQLMKPTDGTLYEVYRFKGNFNPGADVEIRTVLDADGKLAGFFVKPWRETL